MENLLSGLGISLAGGMGALLTTLAFVLLAEMGDKTQLLVMAFATRYKLRQVIVGVGLSIVVLNMLAVLMGSLITKVIPIEYIQLLASISFVIFGILAFRKDDGEEKSKTMKINPTLAIAIAFFVAELGDKTQLATMAFAAKFQAPVQVLIGAIIAMLIADMIGLVAGVAVNKYIPQKYIKIFSGLLFIGFGLSGLIGYIPQTVINSTVFLVGAGALIVIVLLMLASRKPQKIR